MFSSLSRSIRSQTSETWRSVNSGTSAVRRLGEPYSMEVEEDADAIGLSWPVSSGWLVEGCTPTIWQEWGFGDDPPDEGGLWLGLCGNASCLRLCIRLISALKWAAICSEKRNGNKPETTFSYVSETCEIVPNLRSQAKTIWDCSYIYMYNNIHQHARSVQTTVIYLAYNA